MSPEERLLAHVRRWAPRFAAGKARDLALKGPRLRAGERFGVKLTGVAVTRVPADDPGAVDDLQPVLGLAYGTSERLVVAELGRVQREWEWAQLSGVQTLTGYTGVVLRTDDAGHDAEQDAVHRTRTPYDLFAPKPHVVAARWLSLEGCFAASRGELDAWLEALPARVLSGSP